jgi:hypothetical protein
MLIGAISVIIYTLYVKTHNKSGLKYLGQTSQDPFTYSGSGVDWKIHLNEFGKDIHTEILLQTTNKEERNYWGRYYSALWHIVTAADDFGNKIWANRIPETGGGDVHGDKHPMNNPEIIKRISGDNHYTKKDDFVSKISGDNHWSKDGMHDTSSLFGGINAMHIPDIVERLSGDCHWSKQEKNKHIKPFGGKNAMLDAAFVKEMFKPDGIFTKALFSEEAVAKRSGTNHWKYNDELYTFEHIDTGEVISMSYSEFRKTFKCGGNLTAHLNGERTHVKRWRVIK